MQQLGFYIYSYLVSNYLCSNVILNIITTNNTTNELSFGAIRMFSEKKQNLLDEKDLTSIERGLADICEINVHCPGTYVRHIPFLVFQLRFVFVRHKHSDIIEETKSVSIIVGSNSMH